jgi:hypothetical protein
MASVVIKATAASCALGSCRAPAVSTLCGLAPPPHPPLSWAVTAAACLRSGVILSHLIIASSCVIESVSLYLYTALFCFSVVVNILLSRDRVFNLISMSCKYLFELILQ